MKYVSEYLAHIQKQESDEKRKTCIWPEKKFKSFRDFIGQVLQFVNKLLRGTSHNHTVNCFISTRLCNIFF